MLSARGSKSLFFAAFFSLISLSSANATETPILTWERGKSQSVVLGGSTENQSWDLYLERKGEEPRPFFRSQGNREGFYVFTIRVPNKLERGAYLVVARAAGEQSAVVAGVQIIDRITYSPREIPFDLLFLLSCFLAITAMQVSVRHWYIEVSKGKELQSRHFPNWKWFYQIRDALLEQRHHWQSRWLGFERCLAGEPPMPASALSIGPLCSIVLALFLSLQGAVFPPNASDYRWLLGVLILAAFWDQHSGKLVFLVCFSSFLVLNSILNLPSLVAVSLFLLIFLIPRYVGGLVFMFFARLSSGSLRMRYLATLTSSFSAGVSVFWVYLLSESVVSAPETHAEFVTPFAVLIGVSQMFRSLRVDFRAQKKGATGGVTLPSEPVISILLVSLVALISFFVINSWTADLVLAFVFSISLFISLFTVHLQIAHSSKVAAQVLAFIAPGVQPIYVVVLTWFTFFIISQMPETVVERADILILVSHLPVVVFSLVNLTGLGPRKITVV